jgi:hypothetical protein
VHSEKKEKYQKAARARARAQSRRVFFDRYKFQIYISTGGVSCLTLSPLFERFILNRVHL